MSRVAAAQIDLVATTLDHFAGRELRAEDAAAYAGRWAAALPLVVSDDAGIRWPHHAALVAKSDRETAQFFLTFIAIYAILLVRPPETSVRPFLLVE